MDQLRNYTPISNPGHNHNTRRLATDNADHPRTAKFWQSTSAADTRHRATNHSAAQTHGPNRKSLADSRSGPHNTTSQQTTNRDNHQNRRIPTLKQRPEDDQPIHRPSDSPRQRTKSEITYQPRVQSARAAPTTGTQPQQSLDHLPLALAEGEADSDGDEVGESGEVGVFVGVG